MALFLFTKNILAGKPIDVFNHGHHKRDFTFVEDIAEGVVRALRSPRAEPRLGRQQPGSGDQQRAVPPLQHRQQQPVELLALHRGARGVPRQEGRAEHAAAAAG
jgi:UDP-glucuronate 4-epimerase